MGPRVSRLQYDKAQDLIQTGIEEGTRLVVGGLGKPEGLETGHFTKLTVFADADNQMTIAREEVFGPVLAMIPFDSEQQAIDLANDTPYGLAAYVDRNNEAFVDRVTSQLKAGMVRVNGPSRLFSSPFGGYKQSGNGREWGAFGFDDYLEIKAISGGG